jgi:hypothetical protein
MDEALTTINPDYSGADGFLKLLVKKFGIDPLSNAVTLVNGKLIFKFDVRLPKIDMALPANFNIDYGKLAGITSASSFRLSSGAGGPLLSIGIGIDLSGIADNFAIADTSLKKQVEAGQWAVTAGSALQEGILGSDAVFEIAIAMATHRVTIHRTDTLDNKSLADLAEDINAALGAGEVDLTGSGYGFKASIDPSSNLLSIHSDIITDFTVSLDRHLPIEDAGYKAGNASLGITGNIASSMGGNTVLLQPLLIPKDADNPGFQMAKVAKFSIAIADAVYSVSIEAADTAGCASMEQLALALTNGLRGSMKGSVPTDLTSNPFRFAFVARNGKLYLQSLGGKAFTYTAGNDALVSKDPSTVSDTEGFQLVLRTSGDATLSQNAKFSLVVGADHYIVSIAQGAAIDAETLGTALNRAVNERYGTKRLSDSAYGFKVTGSGPEFVIQSTGNGDNSARITFSLNPVVGNAAAWDLGLSETRTSEGQTVTGLSAVSTNGRLLNDVILRVQLNSAADAEEFTLSSEESQANRTASDLATQINTALTEKKLNTKVVASALIRSECSKCQAARRSDSPKIRMACRLMKRFRS